MKKHRISIGCVVLILVLLSFMIHRGKPKIQNRNDISSASSVPAAATNEVGQDHPTAKNDTVVQEPAVSDLQSNHTIDRKTQLEQIQNDWRTPINFYGEVMDENTNPVAGANIHFVWTDLSPTGTTEKDTSSDQNGFFSLQNVEGKTLTVEVSKAGYYAYQNYPVGFFYAGKNENFVPDANNPVIFWLRKKGQGTELVTSQNGIRPDLAVRVSINGDPTSVDLLNKKTVESGDLVLSQIKPDFNHWQQATNWSFHLSIPSGGFVGENDPFPFEAPVSGYQSAVDLNFVQGEPDWATHFVTNFYIVFGQPQKYGWLRVEGDIAQETVFLKYAINPTGSGNLEPP